MMDFDFDKIFIEYYSGLCVFAYRYIRDKQASEDIVEDVFCKFIEKSDTIRDRTSIRSFLYQSTKNGAINYLKNLNNQHISVDYNEEDELNACIDKFVLNDSEFDYDYQLLVKVINSTISSMPAKQKKVFLMSRKQNLSNKEIASVLNISIKAVEKHITKSLAFIRQRLRDEDLITLLVIFILSCK